MCVSEWGSFLMKKAVRLIVMSAVNILICVFVGFALILLVYMIPTEHIRDNVLHSAEMYQYEQVGFTIQGPQFEFSTVDNYTDGLMLLTAMQNNSTGSLLINALYNYRIGYHDEAPNGSIVIESQNNPDNIQKFNISYARYWHGYLIWMKPLLLKFDAQGIRVLGMFSQFILAFFLLYLVVARLGLRYGVAFLTTWLIMNPLALASSFQYYSIFYLILIASIIALLYWKKIDDRAAWPFYFLNIGIAVGYFDLFTYPIASLGIPLILYFLLAWKNQRGQSLTNSIGKIVVYTLFWGIGYGAMWAGKWILTELLTPYSAIRDALIEIFFRMNGRGENISALQAIKANVGVLCKWPFVILFAGILLVVVILLLRREWKLDLHKKNTLLLFLIALFPFAWYVGVKQHSSIHYYFTYRGLAVTVFAFLCILFDNVSEQSGKDRSKQTDSVEL